jgi:hypothetical protein
MAVERSLSETTTRVEGGAHRARHRNLRYVDKLREHTFVVYSRFISRQRHRGALYRRFRGHWFYAFQ